MRQKSLFAVVSLLALVFAVPGAVQAQYGGGGGGSGGPIAAAPVVMPVSGRADLSLQINGGTASQNQTTNTKVQVTNLGTNAEFMAVSNDANFTNVSWASYRPSFEWILTPEIGQKTVYVKFRNAAGGTSGVYTGTINLAAAGAPAPVVNRQNTVVTDANLPRVSQSIGKKVVCSLTVGSAYKVSGKSTVFYVTDACTKRPFSSMTVFNSYFSSTKSILTVNESKLKVLSLDRAGAMPLGPRATFKTLTLVQDEETNKLYVLTGTKRYLVSRALFIQLRFKDAWVQPVSPKLLAKFSDGGEWKDTMKHPDGTLVKYANAKQVFKLQDGKKRAVTAAAQKRLGLGDQVITIDDAEVYLNGLALK